MKSQIPSTFGASVAINIKLLGSSLFAMSAWHFWPQTPEWWGFGLLSICLALGSIVALIGAVKLMLQVQKREKAIREYLSQGAAPKSSELASAQTLRDKGMR
jgi:hypothetical protein